MMVPAIALVISFCSVKTKIENLWKQNFWRPRGALEFPDLGTTKFFFFFYYLTPKYFPLRKIENRETRSFLYLLKFPLAFANRCASCFNLYFALYHCRFKIFFLLIGTFCCVLFEFFTRLRFASSSCKLLFKSQSLFSYLYFELNFVLVASSANRASSKKFQ